MTAEEVLPWLRENNHRLVVRIRMGKYTLSPVRRVEIPKSDCGIRNPGVHGDFILHTSSWEMLLRPGYVNAFPSGVVKPF